MDGDLALLAAGAASLGLVHSVLGPDHYLPFILLGRSRRWGLARTLRLTLVCGVGHVAASLALGALGIAAGLALGRVDALQAARGTLAAWLLVGFGLAYAAWGLRQALRDRPHSHWHAHSEGAVHSHPHVHRGEHAHPHLDGEPQYGLAAGDRRPGVRRLAARGESRHAHLAAERGRLRRRRSSEMPPHCLRLGSWHPTSLRSQSVHPDFHHGLLGDRWTGWTLFTVFVVGPCEPLVPMLMVPAARGAWAAAGLVVAVFAAATLAAMAALVTAGRLGLAGLERAGAGRGRARRMLARCERFAHLAAGLVVTACGVAIWAGL